MAQASKTRPWIVEIKPPGVSNWFHMDAYRDEDEAQVQAKLMRKRSPEAEFRVRGDAGKFMRGGEPG